MFKTFVVMEERMKEKAIFAFSVRIRMRQLGKLDYS